MQNPFYAPYGTDNNCCGDAGDTTGFNTTGYTPGFQNWNAPTHAGWNNPGFTGYTPNFNGYTPGFQGWNAPTYAGWNNPGFTGYTPNFNGETTSGFNFPGFNDFANVPGSNPGTPATTSTTNTGHPGMNWTGGSYTNVA